MTSTLPNESVLIRVPFEKPHNSKTRLDVDGDGRFSPPYVRKFVPRKLTEHCAPRMLKSQLRGAGPKFICHV